MPAATPAPRSALMRCRRASRSRSKPCSSSLEAAAMNDGGEPIKLRIHSAINEIPADAWDACAGDANPTVSHAFLNALEESGSAVARAGWAPQHLTFEGHDGRLLGAAPMYLKSHS